MHKTGKNNKNSLHAQGKRKAGALCIAITVAVALIAGCSWQAASIGHKVAVCILLPEPSPAHRILAGTGDPVWTIRWYDRDGNCQVLEHCPGTVHIELEAESFTPILAEPEQSGMLLTTPQLAPVGAVYPAHAEEGFTGTVLDLTYTAGTTALIAERMLRNARGGFKDGQSIASHFNWFRLENRIRESKQPAFIDIDSCAAEILDGTFRASDCAAFKTSIVRARLEDFLIPIPEQALGDCFFPANPLAESLTIPGSDQSREIAVVLPAGTNVFIGTHGALYVCVGNSHAELLFFSPFLRTPMGTEEN